MATKSKSGKKVQLPVTFSRRGITEGYIVVRAERWQVQPSTGGAFLPHVYVSNSGKQSVGLGGQLYPSRALAVAAAQRYAESGEPALVFKAVAYVAREPRPVAVMELS